VAFKYFNFLGVVPQEVSLHPEKGHGWETTSLEWFTLDEIHRMIAENPDQFHPGLITLFKNSGKKIEQLVGKPKPIDDEPQQIYNSDEDNIPIVGAGATVTLHCTASDSWKDEGLLNKSDMKKWERYWDGRGHSIQIDKARGGLYHCQIKFAADKPRSKYDKVCYTIAMDDALYGYFGQYVQCADAFEDNPAASGRVVELVKSLTPFVPPTTRKCLYRGEEIRMGDDREPAKWEPHLRDLLSWSAAYDTAKGFSGGHRGIVWQTVGKIQGIALEDIVLWRNRTHPDESNYSGMQSEWFVINTCNAKEASPPNAQPSRSYVAASNPLLQKNAAVWQESKKRYKLYHGGDTDLTKVPTYFTNNREYAAEFGEVTVAYVTFNSPLVLNAMEGGFEAEEKYVRDAKWRQEQIEKGYDGLIVVGSDAPNMPQIEAYIPFSPSQIQLIEGKMASEYIGNLPVGQRVDSWSVLEYAREMHEGYEDDGRITQYKEFVLKEVPLDQIDAPWETSEELVENYSLLDTPAPPIVLDHHNTVIDGTHRVGAAYDRGDKSVKAFVPFGDPDSFPTEEEESENALRGLADVD
jgi:hypothetical protein